MAIPTVSDADGLTTLRGTWEGVSAEVIDAPGGKVFVPAMPDFRIGLHLGRPVHADCRCDGQRRRHVQADGDLLFVPAGLQGSWQDDAACRILRVRLSPETIQAAASQLELDPTGLDLTPRLHFRDPAVEHLGRAFFALLQQPVAETTARFITGDGLDRLAEARYAETLGTALALRLLQTSGANLPKLPVRERGLSPRQQRRLTDYVEANLDRPLPLTELAAVLQISVSHLTALFRQSHGISPHQYILQRRLAQAHILLKTSDMPISEIALATGFTHQSHLASVLRRYMATTPRQLRRASTDS